MVLILDGKKVQTEIKLRLAAEVELLKKQEIVPKLVIVQVGDIPASTVYIEQKKKFGAAIGVIVDIKKYPENIEQEKIVAEIKNLNADETVSGIVIQLPLPVQLDSKKLIELVDPKKDVDGLTSAADHMPATAKGILSLLEYYKIPIAGKKAVVVGASALVGRPVAMALLNRGATVTICHRQTRDLAGETRRAEILIAAAGSPRLITAQHVSLGQVVVDVGITRLTEKEAVVFGKSISGDVDFEVVKEIVAAISPVPGGVGPLTVASLFENVVAAANVLLY